MSTASTSTAPSTTPPTAPHGGGQPSAGTGVRERGILFWAPMVSAILEGRETQTRRLLKVDAQAVVGDLLGQNKWYLNSNPDRWVRCPYGVVGDRLWVRETWAFDYSVKDSIRLIGRRDLSGRDLLTAVKYRADAEAEVPRWRPGIHMPRWASRITLEIADVRVQRLQDITEEDARAEGIIEWKGENGARHYGLTVADVWELTARGAYERLWGDINGAESWKANPWVWAVSFRRLP